MLAFGLLPASPKHVEAWLSERGLAAQVATARQARERDRQTLKAIMEAYHARPAHLRPGTAIPQDIAAEPGMIEREVKAAHLHQTHAQATSGLYQGGLAQGAADGCFLAASCLRALLKRTPSP